MRSHWAAAAIIVLAGLMLRLPGLSDPPLDFHPTRQYRAAIIARGYSLDLIADGQLREMADAAARGMPPIEPPVMERIAAAIYHAIGREDLAWARAIAAVAWTLGGLAVFWLAIQLLRPAAALASVTVWTFLPFAIRASQAFQPDALMASLVMFGLAAGVAFTRRPAVATGLLFGCGVAAALAVKAMAAFFLAALAPVLLLAPVSIRVKGAMIAIGILAAVPAAAYYTQLRVVTDYGPFPQLLRQPEFWRGWAVMLDRGVPWPLLVAAVAGMIVARGTMRQLLGGLAAGYVAFGIVFTHHIHTHDYYSLPFIGFAALGAGALVEWIAMRTARVAWPGLAAAAIASVGCVAAGIAAVAEARRSERVAGLKAEAARYERIGRIVGHSRRVLALDGSYALPLIYHGGLLAGNWPLSGDLAFARMAGGALPSADERLRSADADFFVGTFQGELDAQPDLAGTLAKQFLLVERDGAPQRWSFVVYDLRRRILSASPEHLSMFTHVGAAATLEQTVALHAPASTAWTVRLPPDTALSVEPAKGTGSATLRVAAPAPLTETDRNEKVTVTSEDAGSTAFDVRVRAIAGVDKPPFGFVDAPADPVTLGRDRILFQGWALDDSNMKRVWAGYAGASGAVTPLGDASRQGRRPDVAAVYPTAHDLFKAGWTFELDPAAVAKLPRPIQLVFFGEDAKGQRAEIGRRTLR